MTTIKETIMKIDSREERIKSVASQVEKAKEKGQESVLVLKFSKAGYEYKRPTVAGLQKAYGVDIVKPGWLIGQAAEFYEDLDKSGYNLHLTSAGIEVIL